MTRRDLIHKWAVYALGLLAVWLAEGCLVQRLPVLGTAPELLPLAVVSVAVLEGAYAGTGFGLGAGLWWVLTTPGVSPALVLGMAVAGLLTGLTAQYAMRQSYPGCLICSAGLMLVVEGLRCVEAVVWHETAAVTLLRVAAPQLLLTLAWSPLVYWLFSRIYRRVGGTKLA